MDDQNARKVIMVGDAGVGKTSVMFTWVEGAFRSHFPTIGAGERTKAVDVDGTKVLLDIWDTAGQERYRSQIRMYMTGAHAAIAMFDVTDQATINHIPEWVQLVRDNTSLGTALFIVGNKTDLEVVPGSSQPIGDELVKRFGAEGYFQTSAAKNSGIESLFMAVAVSALRISPATLPKIELLDRKRGKKKCC
jgi:small GTP-binding protein